MANESNNICSRCGKVRIVVSTSVEMIGNSKITVKEFACPDPKCQKEVDVINAKDKAKRDEIKENSEKRKNSYWGSRQK